MWESPEYEHKPPINRRQYLCDIVNCPGKTGDVVHEVLVNQVTRLGVISDECVSGVGDGGGENEGQQGIHKLMEDRNPSYVRRRCLLHLPWRVADQGLHEMGNLHNETKAISTYLHEGSTWQRLKAISATPIASGGLALFVENSADYMTFAKPSPPSNQEDRPATTCELLRWVCDRQHILSKLVKVDVTQRHLISKHSKLALESLCDQRRCALRRVAAVLLHKALFLFHYTETKQHVALNDDLSVLFERAAVIISDTRIDKFVFKQWCITEDDLTGIGFLVGSGASFVEVAVHLQRGATIGERELLLEECQAFHTRVALRMRTHLSLMAKNIDRTTWLAARLLGCCHTSSDRHLCFPYAYTLTYVFVDEPHYKCVIVWEGKGKREGKREGTGK